MRRIDNPPNPFDACRLEWLGPPPDARPEVYIDDSQSVLSHNDSPDVPFRWSVNPYRGCMHACAYCYARPTHEYLGFGAGSDFDTRIVVKPDAPRLLRQAFSRRSWKREYVCFSGVTDCYQPLEAVWKLTRGCLEVCRDFANPLGIVTKGVLVLRDLDLLVELNRLTRAQVFISVAFARDDVARRIEPYAPPPSRRFDALRRLSQAGVPVGVMVAPVIPALNDRDIPAVLQRAAECGARSASFTALRLPGSVRSVFLTRLGRALPESAAHVESRIRAMRGGGLSDGRFGWRMTGSGPYWDGVRRLFETTARRLGLADDADACEEPRTDSVAPRGEEGAAPAPSRAAGAPPAAGQLALFDP